MPRPHYSTDFSSRRAQGHGRYCQLYSDSDGYSSSLSFESQSSSGSGSGEEYDPGSEDQSSSSSESVFVTKVYRRRKAGKRAAPVAARHRHHTAKAKRGKKKRAAKPRRGCKSGSRRILHERLDDHRISLARCASPDVDDRAVTPTSPSSPAPAAAPAGAMPPPPPPSGVYALQTLSGDAPSFYVGKSNNIAKRMQDHRDGMGTPYLAGCDVARVPLCTEGSSDDLESWERNETLQRMLVFGIDNVRGWMFTTRNLQPEERRIAFAQICEKNDLCRRCGRNSHFVSECFAKSTAPWANGLPLNA